MKSGILLMESRGKAPGDARKPRARLRGEAGAFASDQGARAVTLDELKAQIQELHQAFSAQDAQKLCDTVCDLSASLEVNSVFEPQLIHMFLESPVIHDLVHTSECPIEIFESSLVLLDQIVCQSPDLLKSFVENGGLRLVLSRVNAFENNIVLEGCVRILKTGCEVREFCEVLKQERTWIPSYFQLLGSSDIRILLTVLVLMPELPRLYPGDATTVIEYGNQIIEKALASVDIDAGWGTAILYVLECFEASLQHSPVLSYFLKSRALPFTFMLVQTFPHQCLLRALPVIKLCYKSQGCAQLTESIKWLKRKFTKPFQKGKYIQIRGYEWLRPFHEAMTGDCDEVQTLAISTLSTLLDFDSVLLSDIIPAGIPQVVVHICEQGSFQAKCKLVKLVRTILVRAEDDSLTLPFVTAEFISVTEQLLTRESSYHLAKSLLLEMENLPALDDELADYVASLIAEADQLGPPPISTDDRPNAKSGKNFWQTS